MILTTAGWEEVTALGNMMNKYSTKIQGSIAPYALIKTRNFITVMGFPGSIQRQGLASWNIKIIQKKYLVHFCACIPSIIYFTCWTHVVIVFFLFHLSLLVIIHMSAMIDNLTLCCFCWLFECMLWQSFWLPATLEGYRRWLGDGLPWCLGQRRGLSRIPGWLWRKRGWHIAAPRARGCVALVLQDTRPLIFAPLAGEFLVSTSLTLV